MSALQQALVSALQQALASALLALGLVCLATQIQRGRVARAWHGASVCSLPRVPQHIVCMRQYAICMYRQQVICVHEGRAYMPRGASSCALPPCLILDP